MDRKINFFSSKNRDKLKSQLTSIHFDLIVIGGGITGSGVCLDAVARGMKVCLIEMNDFASGTSSKSTKLIHGGLRYLEQFKFNLVHETGSERSVLNRLAPSIVKSEKMLLPIKNNGNLNKLSTSIALSIYDYLAGVRIKFFAFSFVTLICLLPVVISFMKPYQKLRILTFFDPDRDPLGAGYQIIQSKIAVGSGGLNGKGFLKGTQNYLEFLPEKHTDFIFTLFSEEFGFIGSVALLLIYSVMIYRIVSIGMITRSFFSRLYCYGFGSAIFVYVVVNMSMVLGLLPIVGSPLPIMSYGGSSMLATMIGISIVMSSKIYHQQLIA